MGVHPFMPCRSYLCLLFQQPLLALPDLTSTEQFTYCLIFHLDPSNLSCSAYTGIFTVPVLLIDSKRSGKL